MKVTKAVKVIKQKAKQSLLRRYEREKPLERNAASKIFIKDRQM